jgi:hypothetical protein
VEASKAAAVLALHHSNRQKAKKQNMLNKLTASDFAIHTNTNSIRIMRIATARYRTLAYSRQQFYRHFKRL